MDGDQSVSARQTKNAMHSIKTILHRIRTVTIKVPSFASRLILIAGLTAFALPVLAAEYPPPMEADWIAKDFRFHTGEVMPTLHLHYTTIGDPSGEPGLVLHGTAGSGATMLTADFAGELFGDGPALDAKKYFIILPDALGTGKDANDFLWQFDASRDYNPSPELARIQAAVLAINSAGDERNPPETGQTEQALKRVNNARLLLIPASTETRGHGTTGMAKFWKQQLGDFLNTVPRRAM